MANTTIRCVLPAMLLLCAVVGSSCRKPAENVAPVERAYGWTIENNQRAKLADYKGQVVVLDFYATWCEPCREETPHLVELQEQYHQQGLQVIGLNVGGADDHDEIPHYAKEFGIQYPLGLPDDELVESYLGNDDSIPQSLIFDRGGRLVKRFVGYNHDVGQEVERVVQVSLAGQPK
jgi:thiol-disulfide isomerase/thioredoxin